MKVSVFLSNPTQSRFDESKISGDIQKMKQMYETSPNLAKRFFSCQDWMEIVEFEKSFSARKDLLQNAVNSISSFDECLQVYKLDTGYNFFRQLWKKFIQFSVSFDQMHQTLDIFHEYKDTSVGKKVLRKMVNLMETMEDFDILSGLISSDDRKLTDALCKRATQKNFSLFQWEIFWIYHVILFSFK